MPSVHRARPGSHVLSSLGARVRRRRPRRALRQGRPGGDTAANPPQGLLRPAPSRVIPTSSPSGPVCRRAIGSPAGYGARVVSYRRRGRGGGGVAEERGSPGVGRGEGSGGVDGGEGESSPDGEAFAGRGPGAHGAGGVRRVARARARPAGDEARSGGSVRKVRLPEGPTRIAGRTRTSYQRLLASPRGLRGVRSRRAASSRRARLACGERRYGVRLPLRGADACPGGCNCSPCSGPVV